MLLRQNLRGCLLHDVGLCKEILISLVYAMIVLHEKSTLCNIVTLLGSYKTLSKK